MVQQFTKGKSFTSLFLYAIEVFSFILEVILGTIY